MSNSTRSTPRKQGRYLPVERRRNGGRRAEDPQPVRDESTETRARRNVVAPVLGPYETSYDIRHGYTDEGRIIVP